MSSDSLQQAVYAALTGNEAVTALAGIYDSVPRDVAMPYLVIGEGSVNDLSTQTEAASEHLFTVHVWSRAAGFKETKLLADAVRACLDGASLALDQAVLIGLAFQSIQFARQSDGQTLRAAMRFRAVTEP